jgi:type IV fimbrial biogenesis protein FimT
MKRQSGFTMSELLIVMVIVAILLSIGVPSYRYITNSYRMSAEVNGLLGDLMYARAEALKEGQWVTVCVSRDGATCTGGNTWASGWIAFTDPNNSGTVDAGETVLRIQSAFTGRIPDTFNASNAVTAISYNREGFAFAPAGGGFANTTITLKDSSANAAWTRCLTIAPATPLSVTNHVATPGCI